MTPRKTGARTSGNPARRASTETVPSYAHTLIPREWLGIPDDVQGLACEITPAGLEIRGLLPAQPVLAESAELRQLANQVHAEVLRSMTFEDDSDADLVVLWMFGRKMLDAFPGFSHLLAESDGPDAGKSKFTRTVAGLSEGSCLVAPTPASLARILAVRQNGRPPMLSLDELDNLLTSPKDLQFLYSVLNASCYAGTRRSMVVPDGGQGSPESVAMVDLYAPMVLAGLADHAMKDTLRSRCLTIRLRTQTADEYRTRKGAARMSAAPVLATRMTSVLPPLASTVRNLLRHDHTLPSGAAVFNRDGDLWEPLFAVAELLGGDWLARAYAAAESRITASVEDNRPETGAEKMDRLLDLALRNADIKARNYNDPHKAPLLGGLGRTMDDFGYGPGKVKFDGMCLFVDREAQRAELRWRSTDDAKVLAQMVRHGRGSEKDITVRAMVDAWYQAGRLRHQAGERTMPESLAKGGPRVRARILVITDWFTWPDTDQTGGK